MCFQNAQGEGGEGKNRLLLRPGARIYPAPDERRCQHLCLAKIEPQMIDERSTMKFSNKKYLLKNRRAAAAAVYRLLDVVLKRPEQVVERGK